MSYYFCSVPQNIALMMKERYFLDVFVETGTYIGKTSEWASKHFDEVYTIEQFETYYRMAELKLINNKNIKMYLNDSRAVLPSILARIANKKALFYLDAHWSKGAQYGRPLVDSTALEEVLLINECDNDHVIIVDDSHRFGTERWPTKVSIIDALEKNGRREVRELLDVLVATPRRRYYAKSPDVTPIKFLPG